MRLLRRLVDIALAAWWTYQLLELVREWLAGRDDVEKDRPDDHPGEHEAGDDHQRDENGSAHGELPPSLNDRPDRQGAYPNTYGIRLEPLTAAERDAAIDGERALARRLAELVGDRVGSAQPAVAASTPSAAGDITPDGVGG